MRLEPVLLHLFKKGSLDWKARARTNDAVYSTARTDCCLPDIFVVLVYPLFDVIRYKCAATVEASTTITRLNLEAVIGRMGVRHPDSFGKGRNALLMFFLPVH
jgi:hypothetical protein